jgi:DNA-binding Lrp family transcriptional regulator
MQKNQQLDETDKKLLNDIQWVFPLVDRPFLEIGNKHGISEDEVMRRIKSMKEAGLINEQEQEGQRIYVITSRGKDYLQSYQQFAEVANSFGLNL